MRDIDFLGFDGVSSAPTGRIGLVRIRFDTDPFCLFSFFNHIEYRVRTGEQAVCLCHNVIYSDNQFAKQHPIATVGILINRRN